jgi:hypothetical protein
MSNTPSKKKTKKKKKSWEGGMAFLGNLANSLSCCGLKEH